MPRWGSWGVFLGTKQPFEPSGATGENEGRHPCKGGLFVWSCTHEPHTSFLLFLRVLCVLCICMFEGLVCLFVRWVEGGVCLVVVQAVVKNLENKVGHKSHK